MSAPGATPGPWVIVTGLVPVHGSTLAVIKSGDFTGKTAVCLISPAADESANDTANAHLIAASPALYDALEAITDSLVSTVEEFGCWTAEEHPKVAAARAAIALARGEAA